jgi:hypothetical protein
MRLSRANMPLAFVNHRSGQLISTDIQKNLAPHFWPDFINPQHFCHFCMTKTGPTVQVGLNI